MNYKIYPISQGTYWIDKSRVAYMDLAAFGTPFHLTHGFFLLKGEDGSSILVDSGCPGKEEIERDKLPYPVADDMISAEEALKKADVDPKSIKKIVLTNLHWDHSWNLDLFPDAEILVQRREMEHAVTPYKHEKQDYCMTEDTFLHGWTKGILRIRALEGEAIIAPGVRAIPTPGMTPGSQSILVDTAKGQYILVSDWAFEEESWTKQKTPGAAMDFVEWFRSYDIIMNTMATILPGHMDSVFEQECYG